ncbi:hypothetical protein EYZ11_006499 [Aspergillus tanneri]|uniref:Rhodopsin domain-containing protein n=1 Tax=Aspergillus tanneri TaxID=1220188 RepID=A0A4S3JHM1_9EURO|nr:hypothetical protein EYZ11_006499 [Aspergillus tanneri]
MYNKLTYTAQLLFILVLSLSKISTVNLILSINPSERIQQCCLITQIGVGLWTLFALFGLAFQCSPPYWEYSATRCVGNGAILYPVTITNMVLDAAVVVIPVVMLWNVQMPKIRRVKISAAFASRLVVTVLNIIQVSYSGKYLNSTDLTWTILSVTTCNQSESLSQDCFKSLTRL